MKSAILLLLVPAVALSQTLETSIVTDWETVQYYGSVEETQRKIDAVVVYADAILEDGLGINIEVTHVEIPQSASDDKLPGHTHGEFLLDALIEYRLDNSDHYYADTTVLLTKRDLTRGTTNLGGIARIGSVCSATSTSVTELVDNGLDGETLAHELAHVLGSKHDGEPPCEETPSYGYIMSPNLHSGNSNFSQCTADSIHNHVDIFGSCLNEKNTGTVPVTPSTTSETGGGGSMGVLFLQLLGMIVVLRMFRVTLWQLYFLQSPSFEQSVRRFVHIKFWLLIGVMVYLIYAIASNVIGML